MSTPVKHWRNSSESKLEYRCPTSHKIFTKIDLAKKCMLRHDKLKPLVRIPHSSFGI